MAGKAEDKWETLTVNIAPQNRTLQRFREVMDTFYLSYCDEKARDTMFKYLRKWKKNFISEAGEHADWMETLVRYANRLPGLEPQLNDDQIKLLIFEYFPVKYFSKALMIFRTYIPVEFNIFYVHIHRQPLVSPNIGSVNQVMHYLPIAKTTFY